MKKLVISMLVAILAITFIAVPALAADPTTTTVSWNGGGLITGIVNTVDTTTTFGINAIGASGSFTATDSNDNPYSYGVDSNTAYIQSSVTNGSTYFQTVRAESTPMYGAGGQTVYAFVGSNGTGTMATGSSTNYAAMVNGTYNQPLLGGANFTATGTNFQIIQSIISGSGDAAQFNSVGNGSAVINCMTTQAGATAADLGWGAGCYTNANATFTGAGQFTVTAVGTSGITTPIADASGAMVAGGWTANGASTLQTIMSYANGGSVGNFSVATK